MFKTSISEILEENNVDHAIEHLSGKKNSSGADGMWLHELSEYWEINRREIIESLKEHSFTPGIVRRIDIVQGNGKRRQIINMNSIDRLLLRCITQKLNAESESIFNERSYAYQHNKGTQDAIKKVVEDVSGGREWLAEIDIDNFFDNISHDRTKELLKKYVEDESLRDVLIKFMSPKIEEDFHLTSQTKGLLTGSPLSPWLSNLYLHEMDCDLSNKGVAFVRYSDNIYILTKSYEDALNKFGYIRNQLKQKYRLDINTSKSGIYSVFGKRILGKEIIRSPENGRVYARRPDKKKYQVYSRWHRSSIQKIDRNYHLINDGILTKKDFTILFENDENKRYLPVETTDSISIYSNIILSGDFLQYVMKKGILIHVFDKYGEYMGTFAGDNVKGTGKTLIK